MVAEAKIEYLNPNMWNWKNPPEPMCIETPFSTTREKMQDGNNIFSSNKCQLPFEDD